MNGEGVQRSPEIAANLFKRAPEKEIPMGCASTPAALKKGWVCRRIQREHPSGSDGPRTPGMREPSSGVGLTEYPTSRLVTNKNLPSHFLSDHDAIRWLFQNPKLLPPTMSTTPMTVPMSEDAVYSKVAGGIPLLFVCYIAAYLDRVNVSFANCRCSPMFRKSAIRFSDWAQVFFSWAILFSKSRATF